MKLFRKIRKALGLKNKYAVKEIKEDGKLRAAVILSEKEQKTLSKEDRIERFKQWKKEQGL
jgi:hypothetical protein